MVARRLWLAALVVQPLAAAVAQNATGNLTLRYPGVPMTEDKCECLNWKKLYDAGRVWCGEGNEFAYIENVTSGMRKEDVANLIGLPKSHGVLQPAGDGQQQPRRRPWLPHVHRHLRCGPGKIRQQLVRQPGVHGVGPRRQEDRPVVLRALLLPEPQRWGPVQAQASLLDTLMQDMTPTQLHKFAVSTLSGKVLHSVFRMSYPFLKGFVWYDVKRKWRKKEFARMPPNLLSAMKANVPMIIETVPAPFSVIQPKKVVYNGTLYALICFQPSEDCLQKEEMYQHPEL